MDRLSDEDELMDQVEELSFVEQLEDKNKLEEDKDDDKYLLMELQKLDLENIVGKKG